MSSFNRVPLERYRGAASSEATRQAPTPLTKKAPRKAAKKAPRARKPARGKKGRKR